MSHKAMQHDTNPHTEQDELSIVDIVRFLKDGWHTIGTMAFLGLGISGSYAFLAPTKYQAEMSVQVATVAGQPVESPALLVEKLKQPTYYSDKSLSDCNADQSAASQSNLARNLKPTLSKTAPVIALSYTALSPNEAKKCLESVLSDIAADQQKIAAPLIKIREDQLASTSTKLAQSEKVMEQLGGKRLNFDFPDQKFSSSTLLFSIILSKQNEITDLRKSIETQMIELAAPQTQSASVLVPIYAPEVRTSPKRSLIMGGGLVGGALCGVIWLLARRYWKNFRDQL